MSERKNPGPIRSFIAGGCAGSCVVFVGQPLDMIKVRLQTMPLPAPGESPLYTGTIDCASKIVKKEGITGLYKGMAAPLAGVAPMYAVSFFGMDCGRQVFVRDMANQKYHELFAAGMFSGLFTTAIMVPGERIKCILQTQDMNKGGPKYTGPVDCAKQLFKEGGIASIYRGTAATLVRDLPASGMYFMCYDLFKDLLTPAGHDKSKLSPLATICAGGLAGMSYWIVAIPPDTLKSRFQTAPEGTYPNGIRSVFRDMMLKEGPFALYKGVTPVMLRAFPANAAGFLGYELALKGMDRLFG